MNYSNYYTSWWHKVPPVQVETLKQCELDSHLIKSLPDTYKDFLLWSNGGEGDTGLRYFSFWRLEDIASRNDDYFIQEFLPDYVAIGDDGSFFIIFDKAGKVYRMPFGDDVNMLENVSPDFQKFSETIQTLS